MVGSLWHRPSGDQQDGAGISDGGGLQPLCGQAYIRVVAELVERTGHGEGTRQPALPQVPRSGAVIKAH